MFFPVIVIFFSKLSAHKPEVLEIMFYLMYMVISAKLIGPSPTFLEHIALPIEAPRWNLNCKIESN
jgi:hypothetical protein